MRRSASAASGREGLQAALDFVQLRQPLRRSDDKVVERPAFPARGVVHQAGAIRRRLRQRLEVAADVGWRANCLAVLVADDALQGRNGRIVGGAGPEALG